MKIVFHIILISAALSCSPSQKPELNIACASNLEVGIDSIIKLFEEETGHECNLTVGASGILNTQIEQGAPYDIFISADKEYAEQLYAKDISTRPEYIMSSLMVLVNLTDQNTLSPDSLLFADRTTKIGMADPEIAPFGKAAKQYLQNRFIWDKVQTKLVFAESLAQLNMYISTKVVDAAFTSEAYVQQHNGSIQGIMLNTNYYDPIKQYYVQILNEGEAAPIANQFCDFLKSEKSYEILEYFGY